MWKRWKQTSSEDKARVIEAKINNPDLSTRDIEKQTWVNYRTSARVLQKDLSQVVSQSETIKKLIDDNNRILNITWNLMLDKLESWDKVSIRDLKDVRDFAIKQNTLVGITTDENKELNITFSM